MELSDTQCQIKESVAKLLEKFDDQYWLERDSSGEFPEEFCHAIADNGWMGIAMPEEYGGSGLGYTEHVIAMQEISKASASVGLSYGAHSNLCVNQITLNGTDEQKKKISS